MNTNRNQSCYRGQNSMSARPYSSNMKNTNQMGNTNQMQNPNQMRTNKCIDMKQHMRDNAYRNSENRITNNCCTYNQNSMRTDGCTRDDGCHKNDDCLDQLPVGMAYIPWQSFRDLYDPHVGLDRGTLFKELDYPFMGKRGNY